MSQHNDKGKQDADLQTKTLIFIETYLILHV